MARLNTVLETIYNLIVNSTTKILKFGTSTNYTQIDTNGRLKNIGDAEMWDDIIGNRVLGTGSLAPSVATVLGNLKLPAFVTSGTDEEFWMFEIMHNTKLDSLVDIHFHTIIAATNNSGNVKFNCEYWFKSNGDTIAAGNILPDTKAITGTNNPFGVTFVFTSTLDITGLTIGDHIILRITRDNAVASNLNASVFSVQAGIHRQIDGFGSDERLTKSY